MQSSWSEVTEAELITVNSENLNWHEGQTVRDVLRERNYIFPLLIVRINGRLIRRSEYDITAVPDDATLDIIHLMSGG